MGAVIGAIIGAGAAFTSGFAGSAMTATGIGLAGPAIVAGGAALGARGGSAARKMLSPKKAAGMPATSKGPSPTAAAVDLDTARQRQRESLKHRRRSFATSRNLGELSLKEEKLGT